MHDEMTQALSGHKADYVELRLEELDSSHISFRGRELDDIGGSSSKGGAARAYVNGAWGFVTFTKAGNLRERVALAVRQASLAAGEGGEIARGEAIVAEIPPVLDIDPFNVPLDQKVGLLRSYVEELWSVPRIQSTSLGSGERRRVTHFANSEGSYIRQERIDVTFRARAIARSDGDVQQYGISVGSLGDYSVLEGRHAEMREISEKAVALLEAPQVDGKEYTVICDPILGGVFAHEAFGHLSESDFVYEDDKMKEIMVLGRRFGGPHLNVIDGASIPALRGSPKQE